LTPVHRAATLFVDESAAKLPGQSVSAPVENPLAHGAVTAASLIARLPKLWIGYALSFATLVGEMIAVARNPGLVKSVQFGVPPLEIFLPAFLAAVYWLVCIHRYHMVLAHVQGWQHPISPARAVWFHLIPFFNIYWVFRWPYAIAVFVNQRMNAPVMSLWTPGASLFIALVCRIFDPALGTALLFFTCTFISRLLKRALEAPLAA